MPVETAYIPWVLAGEGWHNYHHTFPWDYNASEYGAPYNLASYFIRWCARRGYAWDLKTVNEETIYRRAEKTGDGSPILAKPPAKPEDEPEMCLELETPITRIAAKSG